MSKYSTDDLRKEIESYQDPAQIADIRFDFAPYCKSTAFVNALADASGPDVAIDDDRYEECIAAILETIQETLEYDQTVQIDVDAIDGTFRFFQELLPRIAQKYTLDEVHQVVRWASMDERSLIHIIERLNEVWREENPEWNSSRNRLLFY